MKIEFFNSLDYKNIDYKLILVWFFSFFASGLSIFNEFFGEMKPCFLCLLQRNIFLVMTFLPLGLLFFSTHVIKKIFILCLTFSWLVAIFHFLIQTKIIPDTCAVPSINTLQDFEKLIEHKVSCANISWSILGLPISAYNAVISFFLALFLSSQKN